MKLLLDMGASSETATFLRSVGHDAVHLREQRLQRLPDAQIAAKAVDEKRILITFDLGFGRLIAMRKTNAPSVILFRLPTYTTDQINQAIVDILSRFSVALLNGAIVVADEHHIRCRTLPIP